MQPSETFSEGRSTSSQERPPEILPIKSLTSLTHCWRASLPSGPNVTNEDLATAKQRVSCFLCCKDIDLLQEVEPCQNGAATLTALIEKMKAKDANNEKITLKDLEFCRVYDFLLDGPKKQLIDTYLAKVYGGVGVPKATTKALTAAKTKADKFEKLEAAKKAKVSHAMFKK